MFSLQRSPPILAQQCESLSHCNTCFQSKAGHPCSVCPHKPFRHKTQWFGFFKILGEAVGCQGSCWLHSPRNNWGMLVSACWHQRNQSSGDQTQHFCSCPSSPSFSHQPEDRLWRGKAAKTDCQTARERNRHHSPTCHLKDEKLFQWAGFSFINISLQPTRVAFTA